MATAYERDRALILDRMTWSPLLREAQEHGTVDELIEHVRETTWQVFRIPLLQGAVEWGDALRQVADAIYDTKAGT